MIGEGLAEDETGRDPRPGSRGGCTAARKGSGYLRAATVSWEWCTGRAAASKGEITGVLLAIVRAARPGQVVGAAPCGGVLRDLHDH